jgi:hypothetical protein
MYVVCGVVMSGYSTKYIAVTPEELNSKVGVMQVLSATHCIRRHCT